MDKCGSKYDEDTVCQRKAGHRGKHGDFGTDDNPKSLQWSDEGLQRELSERQARGKEVNELSAGRRQFGPSPGWAGREARKERGVTAGLDPS